MSVEQSGNVTPGHLAVWNSPGVIRDGGAVTASQKVLAKFANADMNTDSDQQIILPQAIQYFQLTGIIVTGATHSLATAVGGFYPEAAKEGTPIVAATQVYSALTATDLLLQATLSSFAQSARFSRDNLPDWAIYLSLTTPEGVAALADVYLLGIDLTL